MSVLLDPDTSAAEDGLVRHQREKRPLVLERLNAIVQRNTRTGKQGGLIGEEKMVYGIFREGGEPGKGTTFEM